MQAEYATDVLFHRQSDFQPLYDNITNDVSFFKTHRVVQQRDGNEVWKLAPLRKNIYSLRDVRGMMQAANERYLAFIAAIDNPNAGLKAIDKIARSVKDGGRSYGGSICFSATTIGSSSRLPGGSGASAASGRWTSERIFLESHRHVALPCSSVFARMGSSRKWGVATSTISPCWEGASWPPHSTLRIPAQSDQ